MSCIVSVRRLLFQSRIYGLLLLASDKPRPSSPFNAYPFISVNLTCDGTMGQSSREGNRVPHSSSPFSDRLTFLWSDYLHRTEQTNNVHGVIDYYPYGRLDIGEDPYVSVR